MSAGVQGFTRSRTRSYLSEHIIPVASCEHRAKLRSAKHGDLVVPRVRLTTYGQRSFAYAGPTAWNALPDDLKMNHSQLTLDEFKRRLKTQFLSGLFVNVELACFDNVAILLLLLVPS